MLEGLIVPRVDGRCISIQHAVYADRDVRSVWCETDVLVVVK